jgi:hypothetical protein
MLDAYLVKSSKFRETVMEYNWVAELQNLDNLSDGWDDDGAPKPNTRAITKAEEFCNWLKEQHIISTLEGMRADPYGGICIALNGKNCDLSVELTNNGEVFFIATNSAGTKSIQLQQILSFFNS